MLVERVTNLLLIQLFSDSIIGAKTDILVYFDFGFLLGVGQYCLYACWSEYVGRMGVFPLIQLVSDSNVSPKTATLLISSWLSSVPPHNCPDNASNYTAAASFHILPNSSYI
jgi:hypothetical protein